MLDWFTSTPSHFTEHRTDRYDMAAARDGVGRKKRDTNSLDSKYQILGAQFVPLAPGLTGDVEDWLKISRPLADSETGSRPDWIDVHKRLYTRRFLLDGDLEVGCEVELAEIEVAGQRAWSLCFETFGSPALRERALRAGIDQFMESTPTPDGVEFDHESCHNYPKWLSLLDDGQAHAVERVISI
jgi:hypothetical protein